MADTIPTSNYYKLRGVNKKASKYEMPMAQFLDIRNMDFDVPNALQKRPGATFAVTTGTSGPVTSLFEFIKLTGESYMVAGSDTAMFYLNAGAFSVLDTGWNNGQPADMLTFVNKLWITNGQKWKWWNGNTIQPAGLPMEQMLGYTNPFLLTQGYLTNGDDWGGLNGNAATYMLVGGATHVLQGGSLNPIGVYVAYSYVRSDGYFGPIDFLTAARNIVQTKVDTGQEYFGGTSAGDGPTYRTFAAGFTIPTGYGISAIALWIGVDQVNLGSSLEQFPDGNQRFTGNLGYLTSTALAGAHFMSVTLKPTADLTRFRLFTLIPGANLFSVDLSNPNAGSYIAMGTTFILSSFSSMNAVAPVGFGWSGMTSDFFATFTPKYLDINQNTMFASGFSASPSTAKFSELAEPEVYMPENTFEFRSNDGDRIYAQRAFNNQVVLCKEHSFAKVIGDNADNFQLIELSEDYGCISNNSVVTKDQTMYWLDRKGILEYNGASWRIMSEGVEDIFRRMNIAVAKEKAVGVHHMQRNQLWWGIPIDESQQNNITVVYDYLVEDWTFFDGFNPSAFTYAKQSLARPTVWRGDYSGFVHYTGQSFMADSGRGITCLAFSRFENVGGENQTTLWRRLFLDVTPVSGPTGVINGQLFSNYNISSVQGTFAIYQSQFQSRAEFGLMGKSVAAQLSHSSASLPLLINGYGFGSRGLRNV